MKITKRQLKRIIKEEKRKLVEAMDQSGIDEVPFVRTMEQALNDLFDAGATNEDLIEVCRQLILDIERGFIGEPS
jgi:hypothetical protein